MTQETTLDILKTGVSVFLTGAPGAGKTYVLNQYIAFLKACGISHTVTASTGIAATHIGGVTIHSWSGIGIKKTLTDYDIEAIEAKQYLYKRLTKTQVIIIDEISMLHKTQLDMLDRLLQTVRRDARPFGGVQMVFCGDFFQLPPIITQRELSVDDFVFSAAAWKSLDPLVCYLETQFRQGEGDLTSILESIRSGEIDEGIYTLLQDRFSHTHEGLYTRLYTHAVDVDSENIKELLTIDAEEKKYTMTSFGKESLVESLKKSCLAPEILSLKIGARVMFVKNAQDGAYMNGTLGEVVGYSPDGYPRVELLSGGHVVAYPTDWSIEEEGKIKATITQVPLRLAWAITIHKSQGMSLDKAQIDLSKAFTYGQGYVALSRLRSLEGLALSGFSQTALVVHPEVLIYDKTLKELSSLATQAFTSFKEEEKEIRQRNFVTRTGGVWKDVSDIDTASRYGTQVSTYEETKRLLETLDSFEEIALARGLTLSTILKHCEMLKEEGTLPDLTRFHLVDTDRLEIILQTFRDLKTDKLTPVLQYLQKADFDATYDELRLSRLFL